MTFSKITKAFTFEAAHVLDGYEGKCSRVHGHSYLLEVTLEDSLFLSGPDVGMVMDFSKVSQIVKDLVVEPFDHHFLSARGKERAVKALLSTEVKTDVIILDIDRTTAEILSKYIFEILKKGGLSIKSVKLWETRTGSSEYSGD